MTTTTMPFPTLGPARSGGTRGTRPTHTCAAVGCQRSIELRMLMCIEHWRMVPKAAQRDIWASYRTLHRRPDAAERYAAAVNAAIDAVHGKALARKGRADAQTPPLF